MNNYVIFPEFYTHKSGPWYFAPKNGSFKKGKATKGFGAVRYDEGSIYVGDLYYDGKQFNKIGYGTQQFTYSVLRFVAFDENVEIFKYVGNFNYKKTDWIYGNGVLYFVDKQKRPYGWSKGFYNGLLRTGDYQGEFDESKLLPGFTKEMEFVYDSYNYVFKKELKDLKDIEKLENLFIGSSFMEFWHYENYAGERTFKKVFNTKTDLNLGIGGSKFIDWVGVLPQIKDLSEPKRVFIALSFNDLNTGTKVRTVYNNFLKVRKLLNEYFPHAEVYIFECPHNPVCIEKFLDKSNEYNALMYKNEKKNNIHFLSINHVFDDTKGVDYFATDRLHLNQAGYTLYENICKEIMKK